MPQKRRQLTRRSEPKLFHCTGFGDCNMVFTRSEHLARHARKHTGEKPYKCIVPSCNRMFSRFDNMIQHTHTHNRTKKNNTETNKNNKSEESKKFYSDSNNYDSVFTRSTVNKKSNMEYDNYQNSSHLINDKTESFRTSPHQHHYNSQAELSIPSPFSSTRSQASSEYIGYNYQYHQYSDNAHNYYDTIDYCQNNHLSSTSTLYSSSPEQQLNSIVSPMTDCFSHTFLDTQAEEDKETEAQINKHNNEKLKKFSPTEPILTVSHKRLPPIGLSTPIHSLGIDFESALSQEENNKCSTSINSDSTSISDEDSICSINRETNHHYYGIHITPDEFEALQGFREFSAKPVIHEPHLTTCTTEYSNNSPISFPIKFSPSRTNLAITILSNIPHASKLNAFRQQISPVRESFKRCSRSSLIESN